MPRPYVVSVSAVYLPHLILTRLPIALHSNVQFESGLLFLLGLGALRLLIANAKYNRESSGGGGGCGGSAGQPDKVEFHEKKRFIHYWCSVYLLTCRDYAT